MRRRWLCFHGASGLTARRSQQAPVREGRKMLKILRTVNREPGGENAATTWPVTRSFIEPAPSCSQPLEQEEPQQQTPAQASLSLTLFQPLRASAASRRAASQPARLRVYSSVYPVGAARGQARVGKRHRWRVREAERVRETDGIERKHCPLPAPTRPAVAERRECNERGSK